MSGPLVEVRELTRSFRQWWRRRVALGGVSLDLEPGEIVALVGANGAGKTTLLRVVAGLLAPHGGTVRVAGHRPGSPAAHRELGYAPEAPDFPAALAVGEVLQYYARYHAAGPARHGAVARALEIGGLEEVVRRPVARLSPGWRRRLALAQAVLGGRRVLLLDETLAGVDPPARRALCERLAALAAHGMAILLASHDLAAVERLAARILVLRDGVIVHAARAARHDRVLEVTLDAPAAVAPPGFRRTAAGLERDLGDGTVEAALALCRAYRLAVRGSRVRLRTLEDVVVETLDGPPR